MPRKVDYARMAAFIDGEGHIAISKARPKKNRGVSPVYFLSVVVSNCEDRLMQWCKLTFGGNIYHVKQAYKPNWRLQHRWRINGKAAALLLEKCLPYFVIKDVQARIAIDFSKTMTFRTGGHVPLTQETLALREAYKKELMSHTSRGVVVN